MDDSTEKSLETLEQTALDVEFLPLILLHKIHRNVKSSQVEIVPVPYYVREPTPEPEPEVEGELEPEIPPPPVVFAPPLPAFKERKNWWDFVKPVYSFNNPRIRARVELLMNSVIVHVTDRRYMVRLQEKIREDHLNNLKTRINNREAEEIEREKTLLLSGRISLEEAPEELKRHPVCRINQRAKRIMARKKAKSIPLDKTSAYKTCRRRIRLAEKKMKETVFYKEIEKADSAQASHSVCIVDAKASEDVVKGLMFSNEDYDKLKYEDPLIKLLRGIDAVTEMYDLADRIIGQPKTTVVAKK